MHHAVSFPVFFDYSPLPSHMLAASESVDRAKERNSTLLKIQLCVVGLGILMFLQQGQPASHDHCLVLMALIFYLVVAQWVAGRQAPQRGRRFEVVASLWLSAVHRNSLRFDHSNHLGFGRRPGVLAVVTGCWDCIEPARGQKASGQPSRCRSKVVYRDAVGAVH